MVRVAVLKGVQGVSLSAGGRHAVIIGGKTYVCNGESPWTINLRKETLEIRMGKRRLLRNPSLPVVVIPEGGCTAAVNGKPYRGKLRVEPGPGYTLTVVNILNLEDYLKGVLPCELGPVRESTFEAAKAQAVAARTYALSHRKRNWGEDYDLESTQADQVYGGLGAESEFSNRAVEETFGVVVTYRGEVIEAKYSSTCGGWTANAEDCWGGAPQPYLRSIYDGPSASTHKGKPFCIGSPRFRWAVKWKWRDFFRRTRDNLATLVGRSSSDLGEVVSVRVVDRDSSNRAKTVEVRTNGGVYKVRREAIRRLFQTSRGWLRSRAFHLHLRGEYVVAEGQGFGHGVGMCQWGAMGMAKSGYNFKQILGHYYQGVEIRRVY